MRTPYFSGKTLLILLSVFTIACRDATVTTGDGSNEVTTSGKVMTEEREVPAFSSVEMEGIFNVYLLQKGKESIRIQADEKVVPLIITEVVNDVLTIKMKEDMKVVKMGKINIYVTLKDITRLETKGVGLIQCMDTLNLRSLKLDLKGLGATQLNLNCEELNIESELVGKLFLSGTAKTLKIKHKGIGSFEAFDLKAEKVDLESDGIGKAEIYASQELNVDAKGIGGVTYKGNPAQKNITKKGVGAVQSAE